MGLQLAFNATELSGLRGSPIKDPAVANRVGKISAFLGLVRTERCLSNTSSGTGENQTGGALSW